MAVGGAVSVGSTVTVGSFGSMTFAGANAIRGSQGGEDHFTIADDGLASFTLDGNGGADKIVKLHHSGAVGANYTGGRGLEQNFGSGTGDTRPAFAPQTLDGGTPRDLSFAITQIPEPSTFAMLGAGFGALSLLRRRSRRGA